MRLVRACLLAAVAASVVGCVEEVDPSLRAERGAAAGAPRAETSPAPAVEVAATVRDCTVELATTTAPAGPVSFVLQNDGGTSQELVLRGAQGEWESGPIPAGAVARLSVQLAAGSYRLGCVTAAGAVPPGAVPAGATFDVH